ncbi:hypothetical protein [Mycoplasma anserisalpingitidis]|uniref:Lipoprotein n=1 Tax=Mycoplasma anserisalpingitidis TaxID=519450 RepID=A0A5B8K0W3_9MOLU|nr:hypothetical protein [Mycoplasma anserisalpingitidis]QDY88230.1 hypothetical protein FOY43_00935 [Mycoplasma anserisalpingitidis]
MKKKLRLLKLVLPVATITPALLSASCFGGQKEDEKPVDKNPGETSKPENPSTPGDTEGNKPSTQPVKYSEIIELFNAGSIFKKKISYQEFLKFSNQEGKETGRIDHYINNDGSTTISINKNTATLNESIFSDELLKLGDFTINFKKETNKVGFAYRDELQKGFEIADESATAENAKSSSSRLVFKVDKENETITILSVALYKYIPDQGLILLVPTEKDFVISVDQSTKKPVDNTENTTPENPSTPVNPETPDQPETGESNNEEKTDSEQDKPKNETVVQPSVNLPEKYESLSDAEKLLYLFENDLVFKKYISEQDFNLLSSQSRKRIDFDQKNLFFYLNNDRKIVFNTDIFSDEINLIFSFTKNVKRDTGKIGVVLMDKNNQQYINSENSKKNASASGRFVYEVNAEKKTITIKQLAVAEFSLEKGFKLYSKLDGIKDFVIKVGTQADLEAQDKPTIDEPSEETNNSEKVLIHNFEEIKKSNDFNSIQVDINALPFVLQNILNKVNKVKTSASEEGLQKLNKLEAKLNESIHLIKSLKDDKLAKIFKNYIDSILTSDNVLKINQILEKSDSSERLIYSSLNIEEGNYLSVVQLIASIWEKTINIVADANNETGTGAVKLNQKFIRAAGTKLKSIYQNALTNIYADIVALNYLEIKSSIDQLVKDSQYLDYADELYSLKQYEVLLNNTLTSSNTVLNKYKSEINSLKSDAENNKEKITSLNSKISSLQSAQFQVKTFLNSNKEELDMLKSLTFDKLSEEQQKLLTSLKYKLMTLKSQLERSMK